MTDASILIPVYNERETLPLLFERLYPPLDALDMRYEIIFIDDGSSDGSGELLTRQHQLRPDVTRVLFLSSNAGQHAALTAGFQNVRGRFVVTLDADLQNPPEVIPEILEKLDSGFDYVGSVRATRNDKRWRHLASRMMNRVRERITSVRVGDQGCMLRGYSRDIVDAIAAGGETNTFLPALGYSYAANPTEITVPHDFRAAGQSKYSLLKLVQLNFDLLTGFSLVPLQLISLTGIVVSFLSLLFVVYLAIRRLVVGPEAEGVFTLLGIAIFLMGLLLFSVGVVGEYLGRISMQVRRRQHYRIGRSLDTESAAPGDGSVQDRDDQRIQVVEAGHQAAGDDAGSAPTAQTKSQP